MTVQCFYEKTGGDYAGVKQRLRDDKRILRMLSLLLKDESFALLSDSMAIKDYETAFRAVHTIKGICLNLGLSSLFVPVNELTEKLRGGAPTSDLDSLYEAVKIAYLGCMDMISELLASVSSQS